MIINIAYTLGIIAMIVLTFLLVRAIADCPMKTKSDFWWVVAITLECCALVSIVALALAIVSASSVSIITIACIAIVLITVRSYLGYKKLA